jgi:hypothetical protein
MRKVGRFLRLVVGYVLDVAALLLVVLVAPSLLLVLMARAAVKASRIRPVTLDLLGGLVRWGS